MISETPFRKHKEPRLALKTVRMHHQAFSLVLLRKEAQTGKDTALESCSTNWQSIFTQRLCTMHDKPFLVYLHIVAICHHSTARQFF